MRPVIQTVVEGFGNDCVMVDHSAFQIGYNCCPDNLEGISCDTCQEHTFVKSKTKSVAEDTAC